MMWGWIAYLVTKKIVESGVPSQVFDFVKDKAGDVKENVRNKDSWLKF